MRWWLVGALAVVIGLGAAAYGFRAEIAQRIVQRAAADGVAASLMDELPDGLHVAFCGTGTPLPDRQRAGPCTAIIAGDQLLVFDAGEGAAETLSLMGISPGAIDAVFLTHIHSDHFDGLAPLALQHWANASAQSPLRVLGTPGVARVAAGLNEAYAIDSTYRTAHHGPEIMPPSGFGLAAEEFALPPEVDNLVVYERGGVRVIAIRVVHEPVTDALGYRIEYGGRSVVISGDTARADALVRAAQGGDFAMALTDGGDIVGKSGDRAVVWRDGVAHDLNTVLDNDIDALLTQAIDINRHGRILVEGDDGVFYVLIPSEENAVLVQP